jgi:hypothetical protein
MRYTVTFNTMVSLAVDVEAPDEDHASDKAWGVAEEYLRTIGGNYRDVRAEATLDGIGHDKIYAEPDPAVVSV